MKENFRFSYQASLLLTVGTVLWFAVTPIAEVARAITHGPETLVLIIVLACRGIVAAPFFVMGLLSALEDWKNGTKG